MKIIVLIYILWIILFPSQFGTLFAVPLQTEQEKMLLTSGQMKMDKNEGKANNQSNLRLFNQLVSIN